MDEQASPAKAAAALLKILLPVLAVFSLAFVFLLSYSARVSRRNAVDLAVANATRTVHEFKALRGYYTESVVRKVLQHSKLKASFDHGQREDTIPLPATMILDLSEIVSHEKDGIALKLYSPYPFPNRQGRTLDGFAQEAIVALTKAPDTPFVRTEADHGSERVRVAIADRLTAQACVDCHNAHPLSPKKDWRLGDVRGVLEVTMPLDQELARDRASTFGLGGMAFVALFFASLSLSWLIGSNVVRPFQGLFSDLFKAGPAAGPLLPQIRLTLRAVSLADFALALLFGAECFVAGGLKPILGALYFGLFGAVLIWAQSSDHRGDLGRPLRIIFWWVQGATLIVALPPASYVSLGLFPVMGLILTLPLLGAGDARRYLVFAWAVPVLAFALSLLLPTAQNGALQAPFNHAVIGVSGLLLVVLLWQQKVALQAVFSEVQEREMKFRQAQKMEVVGRLAGGIAHDFNNLLTIIKINSEVLLQDAPKGSPEASSLGDISDAVQRAAGLTRQLLAFSRRQVLVPQVIDLNELLNNMSRMLRPLLGEHIEMRILPSPEPSRVKADPNQIEQVLVNLAVNARDAMPNGGLLTFEIQNTVVRGNEISGLGGFQAGPYVLISVTDRGSGIDKELMERIFEPFFTTKAAGKGSGLGLSTVKGIVEQSGGLLRVYSELGQGSVFKVFLPRVDSPLSAEAPPVAEEDLRGQGQLLLVEDEALLLKATTSILARGGYAVRAAASGSEALQIAEGLADCPELLITDAVMPGMSGFQLAQALRERWPQLKVLLVSGYTESVFIHGGQLEADMDFLPKPFGDVDLLTKVKAILSRPPRS